MIFPLNRFDISCRFSKLKSKRPKRSTIPSIHMVMNGSLFQSAESKDLNKRNKPPKVKSDESLAETPRSSEDDFDSAFTENGENGKTESSARQSEKVVQSNANLLFPVYKLVLIQWSLKFLWEYFKVFVVVRCPVCFLTLFLFYVLNFHNRS